MKLSCGHRYDPTKTLVAQPELPWWGGYRWFRSANVIPNRERRATAWAGKQAVGAVRSKEDELLVALLDPTNRKALHSELARRLNWKMRTGRTLLDELRSIDLDHPDTQRPLSWSKSSLNPGGGRTRTRRPIGRTRH